MTWYMVIGSVVTKAEPGEAQHFVMMAGNDRQELEEYIKSTKLKDWTLTLYENVALKETYEGHV